MHFKGGLMDKSLIIIKGILNPSESKTFLAEAPPKLYTKITNFALCHCHTGRSLL